MNMSRLHIAICAIAASVAVGCTNYGGNYFPDDRPTGGVDNGDDLAIINYIDQRLEEEYYWLDEVREKSATFNRRLPWEEYLKASLSKLTTNSDDGYYNHNGQRYYYSFIREDVSTRAQTSGYGISLHYTLLALDQVRLGIAVEWVYEGTPAAESGIRRGDIIVKYNNADITRDNYMTVFNAIQNGTGGTIRLMLKRQLTDEGETDSFNAQIDVATYAPSPVVFSSVNEEYGTKIGYLVYTSFDTEYDEELLSTLQGFQAEGIEALILDLRCNSGGNIISAIKLVSAILGTEYNERLLCEVRRNPLNSRAEASTEFLLEDVGVALNLREVTIICSENSASASEMVIEGLRGLDIPVKLVGNRTEGKNCGMDVSYRTINGTHLEYAPITFMCFNAKGFGEFGEGIEPDINISTENSLDLTDKNYPLPRCTWGGSGDAAYVAALAMTLNIDSTTTSQSNVPASPLTTHLATSEECRYDEVSLPRRFIGTRIVVEQ